MLRVFKVLRVKGVLFTSWGSGKAELYIHM